MKMYGCLRTRLLQIIIVSTVSFFTVSLACSESELLLTMERWEFEVQSTNYLVRFTIKVANGYERPIERIDAFLYFVDTSGSQLAKVYVDPHIKIQPGESQEGTWIYMMNPFSPMLKMKPDDIRATLVVRGLHFSTGEGMAFTTGSGVIH